MKLYYSPGACSLAPHIALMEAGIKFEVAKVDLRAKKLENGDDYYQINPKGYVPAIRLDDGDILCEASVLLQYIADQKPEKSLIPKAGTKERYHAQEMLNYIATELHKGFSPLWNSATPEEYKKIAIENLYKKFDFLEKHFKSNPFCLGQNFSVADCYLFTVLSWTKALKIDLSKWSNVTQFMERVRTRPSVKEAMIAEGLLKN